MRFPITHLKNKHAGDDVWVLASGPSMNFIDPDFFSGKLVIGVNEIYRFFPVSYVVWKEVRDPDPKSWNDEVVITSKHDCGNLELSEARLRIDHYVFEHSHNENTDIDLSVLGTDKIVVSYSTTTSAMHIAAYMGASNIILCGHDCGFLDGEMNLSGYPTSLQGDLKYRKWIKEIEPQTSLVRDALQVEYGCRIYSLNPFLNLGLEGHEYR